MEIIPSEFSLETIESHSDENELLQIILDRVDYLMEFDIDLLMSYLYRLDVLENDITAALAIGAVLPANQAIARLILERQKKRMESRKKYKQDPIEGWEF